jgi:hypothetical protein
MELVIDYAWAAGFFAGEGSTVAVHQPNRKPYLGLSVAQIETEPLDRFLALFGGRVNGPYIKGQSRSGLYHWAVSNGAAVMLALHAMWPHLTTAKKRQAIAAVRSIGFARLQEIKSSVPNRDKTHCKRGHEFTEMNTRVSVRSNGRSGRGCKACEVVYQRSYRAKAQ